LKGVGKDRNGNGSGEFVAPTQIAVSDHGIVVLDTEQSRIQVLDLDGNRTGCCLVITDAGRDNGLAVDRDGNIYISYVASSIIGIYNRTECRLVRLDNPAAELESFLLREGCGSMQATASTSLIRRTRGCKSSKSVRVQLPPH